MTESYSLLANMLLIAIEDTNQITELEEFKDGLEIVDKLSAILKRVADTTIIDEIVKNDDTDKLEIEEEVETL